MTNIPGKRKGQKPRKIIFNFLTNSEISLFKSQCISSIMNAQSLKLEKLMRLINISYEV